MMSATEALRFLCALAVAASASAADLSGRWVLGNAEEGYTVTSVSDVAFTVVCDLGPCAAWKRANLTVTGVAAVAIAFDSGLHHTGSLNSHDDLMSWTDASVWLWQPQVLNVHLCPHSHNDPGWRATYWQLFSSVIPGDNDYAVSARW